MNSMPRLRKTRTVSKLWFEIIFCMEWYEVSQSGRFLKFDHVFQLPKNGIVCETDQSLFPVNSTLISPNPMAPFN